MSTRVSSEAIIAGIGEISEQEILSLFLSAREAVSGNGVTQELTCSFSLGASERPFRPRPH